MAGGKQQGTAVAEIPAEATGLITPEMADLYNEHADVGAGDLDRDDYALPWLKILQGLSPELERSNTDKFIPGASVGDLVLSSTGEVFPGNVGVRVIRTLYETKYLEWRPRTAGGGLVAISDTEAEAKAKQQPVIGNKDTDTEITETAQVYLLIETKDGWTPAVFAATKTKLKEMRAWNTLTAVQTFQKFGITPKPPKTPSTALPHPGVIYRLKTASRKNTKGVFAVPTVDKVEITPTPPTLFKSAIEFRDLIKAGAVQVKHENDEPQVGGVEAGDIPGAGEPGEGGY